MKKPKILHTITRMIVGGAAENTLLSVHLLDKNKYSVSVISGVFDERSINVESFLGTDLPVITYPNLVREISPWKDVIHFIEIIKYLKKQKVDIIHTHSSKAGIIHRLAARLAGVPVIIHTVHGWSFNYRMNPLIRFFYIFLEKLADSVTDKLITVTMLDTDKGLRHRIGNPAKYLTIHSSIDIGKYRKPDKPVSDIRAELGILDNELVIGTVSRMDQQKAPIEFMKVAKAINSEYPEIKFLFVGDGDLRNSVEKFIIDNGLQDKVILTGTRSDINNMLAVMDIFILTSLWEGLPRVFSQAMAAGLPIVATRVDGAPEAVIEGKNGFLVDPGDTLSMKEKLQILIEDENKRIAMAEYGNKHVLPDFDVKNMISDLEQLYDSFLNDMEFK